LKIGDYLGPNTLSLPYDNGIGVLNRFLRQNARVYASKYYFLPDRSKCIRYLVGTLRGASKRSNSNKVNFFLKIDGSNVLIGLKRLQRLAGSARQLKPCPMAVILPFWVSLDFHV